MSWSNGDSGSSLVGLCAGTYSYTVFDGEGCSASGSVVLECVPGSLCGTLSATAFVTNDSNCDDDTCDAAIALLPVGGTAPYVISWSDGGTATVINGLCAGTYAYTITDDEGCTLVGITNVACDTVDLCAGFSAALSATPDSDCDDLTCDGSIELALTGGSAPFDYLWNTGASSSFVDSLCAGSYSVTVTDAAGCVIVDSVTLTCNSLCANFIAAGTVVHAGPCSAITCEGAVLASGFGGVEPYTYVWEDGSTESSLLNLCAGTYSVTITDANQCTVVGTFDVGCTTVPPCIIDVVSTVTPDQDCDDAVCDGLIELAVFEAVGDVTFIWSNGATTQSLENVCAGVYTVTVVDSEGCDVIGPSLTPMRRVTAVTMVRPPPLRLV